MFEHREFAYAARFVESDLLAVAEGLVRLNVDVIVLVGGNRAQIIQRVTGTIPIVTLSAAELVTSGVVASLARPGGTITGVQSYSPELQGKRLQILKELMPKLSRVAMLRRAAWHPGMLAAYQQPADSAAQKLGLRLHYVVFQTSDELPGAFAGMVAERAGAIVVWVEPGITLHVREILDLAARHRLPTMAEGPTWLDGGALSPMAPTRRICGDKPRPTWTAF